jgi:predicted DNA-binding transcriptional regulator YafY
MYDPSMRVLTVLELLQSRERVSGQELADELEVSVRTVQRYVMRLQDLGVPVESTRGPGGAYRLAPGFRMPPLMLGTEEAFAVALGLDALTHLGLCEVAPAAVGARTKLNRVLPLVVNERVDAVRDTLLLEPPRSVKGADMSLLLKLAIATNALRCVRMSYRADSGEQTQRTVEPLGLMQYEGRWFLAAYCLLRDDFRLFRVDRIGEAEMLQDVFERPADFDLRSFVYQRIAMAEAPWQVEVWLDLPANEVESRLPRAIALLSEDQGGTMLRSTTTDLEHMALLLMPLNCAIEIRQPEELREAFRAVAERAVAIATNQVTSIVASAIAPD